MPRRVAVTLAVVVVVLITSAAPALAKGPTGATITGPGIDAPIVVEGFGERGGDGTFSELVEAAGFWWLVGGVGGGPGRLLDGPPSGDLGPVYLIAWHLGDDTAQAEVYPDAPGGPVVHVAPENIVAFGISAPGGWFAAPSSLRDLLARYGVPVHEHPKVAATTAPPAAAVGATQGGTFSMASALVVAALLGAAALWAVGRRPRRTGAP